MMPRSSSSVHDGVGALGLEDAAVVHQAQAPGRRLDDHFVDGAAVAGVAPDEFIDHAGEAPYRLAVLPHHQIHRLFQNVSSGHIGVGARQF
jgi:hypothetical protein